MDVPDVPDFARSRQSSPAPSGPSNLWHILLPRPLRHRLLGGRAVGSRSGNAGPRSGWPQAPFVHETKQRAFRGALFEHSRWDESLPASQLVSRYLAVMIPWHASRVRYPGGCACVFDSQLPSMPSRFIAPLEGRSSGEGSILYSLAHYGSLVSPCSMDPWPQPQALSLFLSISLALHLSVCLCSQLCRLTYTPLLAAGRVVAIEEGLPTAVFCSSASPG